MTVDKYNIDKLFNNLKGFEEEPPIHVWDNVKDEIVKDKRKRKVAFIWAVAASVSLLIAFGTGYFIANYQLDKQIITETDETQQNIDNNSHALMSDSEIDNSIQEKKNPKELIVNNESDLAHRNVKVISSSKTDFTVSNSETNNAKNNGKSKDNKLKYISLDELYGAHSQFYTTVVSLDSLKTYKKNETVKIKYIQLAEIKNKQPLPNVPPEKEVLNEQLTLSETKRENRWTLGGFGAPTYSYRHILNGESSFDRDDAATTSLSRKSITDYSEDALMAYSGGIDVGYNVSKRLSLHSGIVYSKIGQVNNTATLTSESAFTKGVGNLSVKTSYGDIPTDKSNFNYFDTSGFGVNNYISEQFVDNSSKVIQNFEYLEVPFLLSYKVIDKKIDFNLKGGLSPGILIGNKAYVNNEQGEQELGETEDIRSVIYNSVIGLGIGYDISEKIQFKVEPLFKYSLTTITEDNSIGSHPYSISIFTGINYIFH